MKKSLLSLSLISLLNLSFMSAGCNGSGSIRPNTATGTKKINVGTWTQIDSAVFNNRDDTMGLVVSGDKSHAYVGINNSEYLYALRVGSDFALSSLDVAKWHKIALQMADGGPGKAQLSLDSNNLLIRGEPSFKGIFVSIDGDALTKDEIGVWYIEGTDLKAGWATKNADIDNAAITNQSVIYGFVTKKNNIEYPLILVSQARYGVLSNTTFDAPAPLRNNRLKRNGNRFNPFNDTIIATMGATDFYIIDQHGINIIPESALGEAAPFRVDDPATFHASLKPDQWGTLGAVANDTPSSAFFDNGNLYIGFDADTSNPLAPTKGGVAVHDVASKVTKAPHADWTGIKVFNLAKDGDGNVWAVTKNALIQVVIGAATIDMGKKLNNTEMANHAVPADPSAETDYQAIIDGSDAYASAAMPDNINGAAFFGKHLLITSSTAGVHVLTFKEKSYKKP